MLFYEDEDNELELARGRGKHSTIAVDASDEEVLYIYVGDLFDYKRKVIDSFHYSDFTFEEFKEEAREALLGVRSLVPWAKTKINFSPSVEGELRTFKDCTKAINIEDLMKDEEVSESGIESEGILLDLSILAKKRLQYEMEEYFESTNVFVDVEYLGKDINKDGSSVFFMQVLGFWGRGKNPRKKRIPKIIAKRSLSATVKRLPKRHATCIRNGYVSFVGDDGKSLVMVNSKGKYAGRKLRKEATIES